MKRRWQSCCCTKTRHHLRPMSSPIIKKSCNLILTTFTCFTLLLSLPNSKGGLLVVTNLVYLWKIMRFCLKYLLTIDLAEERGTNNSPVHHHSRQVCYVSCGQQIPSNHTEQLITRSRWTNFACHLVKGSKGNLAS